MNRAKQLAIASEVQRIPSFVAERFASRIERGGRDLPARYYFDDGSQGEFVTEIDRRGRVVVRFEEVAS